MAVRQITRIRIPEPEERVLKNLRTEALKPHRLPRPRQPPAPPTGLVLIDDGGAAFLEPRLRPILQVTEEELDELHQIVSPGSRRRREWGYPSPVLIVCPDHLGKYWKAALAAIAAGFLLYLAARALRRRWARRLGQEDIGGPPPRPQGDRGGGHLELDGLIGVAGPNAAGQMLVIRPGMVALIVVVPAPRRRSLGGGHRGGGLLDLLAGVNAAGLVRRAFVLVLEVPPPRLVLASTSTSTAGPSSPRSTARSLAATREALDDLVDGAVRTARRVAVGILWTTAREGGPVDADVERMRELIIQLRAWRSITIPEDHTSKDEGADTNEEQSSGDDENTENHS